MLMNNSSQVSSLSEASVCSSSMGIRTPDVHPVPDTTSSVAQVHYYGDHSTKNRYPQQQQHWMPEDPVWPIMNDNTLCHQQQQQPYGSNVNNNKVSNIYIYSYIAIIRLFTEK